MEHYFIRFEIVNSIRKSCVKNAVIKWHIKHGWVYNIWSNIDERYLGVFYCTLLAGDGVVLHFDTCVDDMAIGDTLAALKKGVEMMKQHNIVLATIPTELKVCRIAKRLGFKELAKYYRNDKEICLFMLQK